MTTAPIYELTLPQLLARRALEHGDRLAMREKDLGLWRRTTWREFHQTTRLVAIGLRALGLDHGERIAIAS